MQSVALRSPRPRGQHGGCPLQVVRPIRHQSHADSERLKGDLVRPGLASGLARCHIGKSNLPWGPMDSFLVGAQFLLAGVFALAGTAKLFDLKASRQAVLDFGLPKS